MMKIVSCFLCVVMTRVADTATTGKIHAAPRTARDSEEQIQRIEKTRTKTRH